ncbi:hypothetical protein HYZ99_00985 [Candidatus Peregrinibacteria bacterium]|nr:hypothetical protein [Candidatus Peregrinibacteria bacterium]
MLQEMLTLGYWFYPNPANASYDSPKAMALLGACALLVLLGIALRVWRGKLENPITRKLSATWSSTAIWFGLAGLIMVVSRVEQIQFVSMRALWVVWGALLAVCLFFQMRRYRQRHYTILPNVKTDDPRDRYLPAKKKH